MSMEIFRDIQGYENYQITSWGRVYSKISKDFLAQEETDSGYLRVTLVNEEGKRHCRVHRLVAGEFVPNPLDKPQVNHIDGNRKNNSFSNLEWVTNKENKIHGLRLRRGEWCDDTADDE